MMVFRPITITEAKAYVAERHRHAPRVQGGLFALAVEAYHGLCGVAIVGRPVAHELQDGFTCEVTRVCTDGTRNACSKLYSSAKRIAQIMGYRRVITYTLQEEAMVSPAAAGFEIAAMLKARPGWDCAARSRETLPTDNKAKARWEYAIPARCFKEHFCL